MIVYRDAADTRREYPVPHPSGSGWTYASWHRYPVGGWTEYTVTQDKPWATESEAVEAIRRHLGHDEWPPNSYLGSVRVPGVAIEVSHPTEGWPEAEHWQAPEGSPEIEVGQVWYRAGRAAVIEAIGPMHPTGALGLLVRFANPNPAPGSSMRRTPAAHWYGEEHFRKLYKPNRGKPDTGEVSPIVHSRSLDPRKRRRRRT